MDTGDNQNADQQQGRGHRFDNLSERDHFFLCFLFSTGQADTGTGGHDRNPEADRPAEQRRELIVDLCQQQIRHGTGENADQNKHDITADLLPADNKTQRQQRDHKCSHKVDQRGVVAYLINTLLTQPEVGKTKPGRCTDGAERNRHGVHHQRQQGNPHGRETETDQDRCGDSGRRSEPACALNGKGECPADNHQLCHRIGADIFQPAAHHVFRAAHLHQLIEHNRPGNDGDRCQHRNKGGDNIGAQQCEIRFKPEQLDTEHHSGRER